MKMIAIVAAGAALLAAPALAQQSGASMQHGQMAKQDYMKGMQDMHQKMMSANDADPDRALPIVAGAGSMSRVRRRVSRS